MLNIDWILDVKRGLVVFIILWVQIVGLKWWGHQGGVEKAIIARLNPGLR